MKTIDIKRDSSALVLLYPIANILFSTLTGAEHYSTFTIMYVFAILLTCIWRNHCRVDVNFIIIGSVFLITMSVAYNKSGSILLQFFSFLLLLDAYHYKDYEETFKKNILESDKLIFRGICFYLAVLFYTVVFKDGIQTGWGTVVLYGPYSLSHILAYELLAILCLALFVYKIKMETKWLVLGAVLEVLIVLTCVRSAILSSAFVLIWLLHSFNLKRKFEYILLGGIVLGILAYFRVFDQVITKSLYAMGNGSITNGREWIVNSVSMIYEESSVFEKVFGSGYENLLRGNYRYLGTAIQGHNDLLTILISFGIVGGGLYTEELIRFIKGKGGIGCFLMLAVLVYYNGLFLYTSMVIGLIVVRIFFRECGSTRKKNNNGI